MSVVGRFSNQLVSLERKSGADDYGDVTYDSAVTIRARFEPKVGLRRSITGDDVATESLILTETEINLGDRIEGSDVRRVETIVDKGGNVLGYQAYL